MTSTWACKKKSNGVYRAQLNLHGFLQVEGEHYDAHSIASPVVNIITIHIVLALIAIVGWYAALVDVHGAFLLGDWESDRQIFMEIPKGWSHHYQPNTVLRLLKTVYGAKQSAKRFWIKTLKVMDEMKFARCQADPCLYFQWHSKFGLIMILSWVDDLLIVGTKEGVKATKKELFKHYDCDDTGEMKEYIGNKVDRKDGRIKLTQPVLLQSFGDEFKFERDRKVKNPAVPGTVLHPTENKLSDEDQFTFRSGTGKLLHLMKWSRPEIGNAVRELSHWMTGAGAAHLKAMYRVFNNYCLNTSERGKVFKPHRTCAHGDIDKFEFIVEGYSDSDYAKDPVKR
jgi:Reverse transcriptase (RNA-dependent DNA polymerase)